jgi:DNA-binding Lrp family transcriptional regulator
MMLKPDMIDRKIIGHLRTNGRMPNNELADKVGLSASACLRRVRLLEQGGVIRGYAAIVSDAAVNQGVVAIVRITLDKQTEEYLNRFEFAVRMHPEIEECYLMTGDADYILRATADSTAAYERIHKEILSKLPGVARINSSFAMRRVLGGQPSDGRDREAADRGA